MVQIVETHLLSGARAWLHGCMVRARHKIRFLSASGQATTLHRTLLAHLSKAFDDEGEVLGAQEFMDDCADIAPEHRIRVTAKEVCDEASTALFLVSTPVVLGGEVARGHR